MVVLFVSNKESVICLGLILVVSECPSARPNLEHNHSNELQANYSSVQTKAVYSLIKILISVSCNLHQGRHD